MTTILQDPASFAFSPMLGPVEARLLDLVQAAPQMTDSFALVEALAEKAASRIDHEHSNVRELCWAFSMSLLSDLLAAGATLHVVDSTLHVTWPRWESSEGRNTLRRALLRLRSENDLVGNAASPNSMPGALTPEILQRVMADGVFRLAGQEELDGEGVSYQQVFRTARRYWTMPDRDREGRSKRFVLTVEHPALGRRTPVGVLEASDGAPHDTIRDARLGLTTQAFGEWVSESRRLRSDLELLETRLAALREALLPIESVKRVRRQDVYRRWREFEALAAGRSKEGRDDISQAKRLGYLVRIIRAQEAVRRLRQGESAVEGDVYSLVRLLRDLTIPRVHLDISVCGALPPFSSALGGKLVAAFMADPRIVGMCKTPPGEIARSVFHATRLSRLIPGHGALLITTKGLYAGHSAQYERVVLPGRGGIGQLQLRQLGNTQGMTASLVSRRSYSLAARFLEASSADRTVSSVFGSGGSKRQRKIEAAARMAGLTEEVVHPRIRRPIYGAELVDNVRDVTIVNRRPKWRIEPRLSTKAYAEHAVAGWRARWSAAVTRRLLSYESDVIPGLQEWLESEGGGSIQWT